MTHFNELCSKMADIFFGLNNVKELNPNDCLMTILHVIILYILNVR